MPSIGSILLTTVKVITSPCQLFHQVFVDLLVGDCQWRLTCMTEKGVYLAHRPLNSIHDESPGAANTETPEEDADPLCSVCVTCNLICARS